MSHLRHKTNKRIYKYVYFKPFIWNLTFHICKLFWRSMQYMRGGRHWLIHPPSQDILTPEPHILINPARPSSFECKWELQEKQYTSETRDRRVANMRLAAEIVGTDRNTVLWAYTIMCVCVCGNLYPCHHISFKEHLPEDGNNRWPKHVGGYAVYTTINLRIFICTCWFSFS